MRRNLLPSARSAASITRGEIFSTSSRAPFLCASCRRAAAQYARTLTVQPRRSFVTTSPLLQQAATAETQQSRAESVAPQTHYEFFPNTFPNGPPPHSSFTPDLKQLRKEFLQLQSKSHPDLMPQNQKRQAEALSMRLNEAYKALQDPLKRAQYLLSLRGIDVEDESAKLEENQLLMEVMEAREAVDEVENEDELGELREENNDRIGQSVTVLEEAFAKDDMEKAAQEAIRLRYWMNIEESIQGWEKGNGGGLLHH